MRTYYTIAQSKKQLEGRKSENERVAIVGASDTEALLTQIQERGELVAAMEGTWAPWTYHDESDMPAGCDVEAARLAAEKLGVEVRFVEGEWDGPLAGLDDGRYDIMVNGVGITPERSGK